MTLAGKGVFIWKIRACELGDVNQIANLAQQAGFSHVLVKVADGAYSYNVTETGDDLVPPLLHSLRSKGIQVWGWHYIYGDYPRSEADRAVHRINQLNLDGYVLDVEGEYKQPGKYSAAKLFMSRLRAKYPHLPIALSSYRFPSYHPQVPWKAFLESCDFNMPQVYWQYSHNPADQLIRSVREFQSLTPFRPIIPTGSAYRAGSWLSTPADVKTFMQSCQAHNLPAFNFWEWSNCRKYLPDTWRAIADFPTTVVEPPKDIAHAFLDALNSRDPNRVADFYSTSALHITSARTTHGVISIRKWYSYLFHRLLPNASFNLTGFTASPRSRHLTWTASSDRGAVHNGSDTLGIHNDKIAYHYSFFTVT